MMFHWNLFSFVENVNKSWHMLEIVGLQNVLQVVLIIFNLRHFHVSDVNIVWNIHEWLQCLRVLVLIVWVCLNTNLSCNLPAKCIAWNIITTCIDTYSAFFTLIVIALSQFNPKKNWEKYFHLLLYETWRWVKIIKKEIERWDE